MEATSISFVGSALGGEGDDFLSLTGEEEVEQAGEALSEPLSLDPDLDLFGPGEVDLDFDLLLLFLGDLDLFLAGAGECDFDRYRRDNERDLERL